jgi:hypothetical protein
MIMKFIKKFLYNIKKNIIYALTLLIICYGLIGSTSVFAPSTEGSIFETVLDGKQVSPPVNTTGSGNASLFYKHDVSELNNFLLYNISVSNIDDVTRVHLHQGTYGVNGTLSNNLTILPNYEKTGILSNGNISNNNSFQYELSGKAKDVIDIIMKYLRSGEMYIDIHTKKYPEGEIRGQIYPKY